MDVMIDIETTGQSSQAVIISLAAVAFRDDRSPDEWDYYTSVINRQSCLGYGLVEDADTLRWWEEQSDDARKILDCANSLEAPPLRKVLMDFSAWFELLPKPCCVWSKPANFDLTILENAYRVVGLKAPWHFRNVRCHRTLENLYPQLAEYAKQNFQGVRHNALDDARNQGRVAVEILSYVKQYQPAIR